MHYLSLLIYDFAIKLYQLGIWVASFSSQKAKEFVLGRKNIFDEMQSKMITFDPLNRVWIHVSSLGEFEQAKPLIELFKKNKPDWIIILTFFSPSGYLQKKNYPLADAVFYLPLDTKANALRFLEILKPKIAIMVKYDFWYHYLNQSHKLGVRIYCVSTIFRKNQIYFKPYGWLLRKILFCFHHIFVQDVASQKLLEDIGGIRSVTIAPDTRVDSVSKLPTAEFSDTKIEHFLNSDKAIVLGSVYEEEINLLIELFQGNIIKDNKVLIFPHNINANEISRWKDKISMYCKTSLYNNPVHDAQCMIVDTIGILGRSYKYAKLAWVGGGFGKSIHNILEPASFGIPILIGSKYHKFKEANDLITMGGVKVLHQNFVDDSKTFQSILYNKEISENMGTINSKYIQDNLGGAEICFKTIVIGER